MRVKTIGPIYDFLMSYNFYFFLVWGSFSAFSDSQGIPYLTGKGEAAGTVAQPILAVFLVPGIIGVIIVNGSLCNIAGGVDGWR
jgi:hypothetical protein